MKTVSVVMATYNGGRFISEQLKSLADQDTLPAELIIADDGSTDRTLKIVEDFSGTAPFPVVVKRNEQRLGYGENFLSAARLATGDIVAFCDQDDVWHPTKLTIAVGRISDEGADLLVHAAGVIDQDGHRTGIFSQGITKRHVYQPLELGPWVVLYGCCMVFSRKLLTIIDSDRRGGHTFEHEGLLSHDLWIYFLATSLGRVAVDNRPLIDYRQHQANVTPSILAGGPRVWLRSLGTAADPRLRRDSIAEHRSRILHELGASSEDMLVRQAATHAAHYWRSIARFEHSRIEFYAAEPITSRAKMCAELVRSGGYRIFRSGGLGPRLLLKDILVGVLHGRQLAHRLTR